MKLRINDLTKAEKKALLKEICRICEKQYRKGYQQGFTHGSDKLVTAKEVSNFRIQGSMQGYSKVVYPPYFKHKADPIERVSCELDMSNMDILQSLFREFNEI